MIAIQDKSFVIFLQNSGFQVIDYRSIGRRYGVDDMAYIFNDVNRIRVIKEAYEDGALDIFQRSLYYKRIGGQQETLAEIEKDV